MRRRLLDLCLLAYPRASRQRDSDYLRDLALDLAERQGLARQAVSLLSGRGPGACPRRREVELADRRGLAGRLGVGVRWVGGERGRAG